MSSVEIKEMLDNWYLDQKMEEWEDQGQEGDEEYEQKEAEFKKALGKWKRLSKVKNRDGDYERVFENKLTKEKVLTIEDDIMGFLANGKYVFHIFSEDSIIISDYDYFKKYGYCSDWHLSYRVIIPSFMGEEAEGVFSSSENIAVTRKELLDQGFVEDKDFSAFVCESFEEE